MTRDEARAVGEKRYTAGRVCPRGHVPERWVSTSECVECQRLKSNRRKAAKRILYPRPRAGKLRERARLAGEVVYRGNECGLGHGRKRYVRNSGCVECVKERARNKPISKKTSTAAERAKRREKARKYKARKRAAGPNYTAADVVWLRERQGGKCGICLLKVGKLAWEVDHRVSLADGGSNDRLNLHITHRLCNRSKGKRHEIDHARERFGRLL